MAVPDCDPKFFFKTLCGQSRGTTQTACGWHTDILKDVNVAPKSEADDPLFGFRCFSIAFASGTLPILPELYSLLAGSKLVALEKDDGKPRPVGITGVFHRI